MSSPVSQSEPKYAWYRELTGYHWFVLSVASMGWMFDTMAQQLFNLARRPAMAFLMGPGVSSQDISYQASLATTIFLIGWGIGGILGGVLGDRIGRAKTMMITIHAGINPRPTKAMNAEQIRILSASGSIRMPKFVISFLRRAIWPSRKSLMPAAENSKSAIVSWNFMRENITTMKPTVRTKRQLLDGICPEVAERLKDKHICLRPVIRPDA